LQISSVHCFFDTCHITVHIHRILNSYLLIKNVFIFLLVLSSCKLFILVHLSIVSCLELCLVFVKFFCAIHFFKICLFFLLNFKLLIIQFLRIFLLLIDKLNFLIKSHFDFVSVSCFSFSFEMGSIICLFANTFLVFILHVFLIIFNFPLVFQLDFIIIT
jgi:hypothetical protein